MSKEIRTLTIDTFKPDQRRAAVIQFVITSVSGDVSAFVDSLQALTWDGAWRDVFQEVVQLGFVHPAIRKAFRQAWRGAENHVDAPHILAEQMGWSLTRDFEGHLDLMAAGLKLLLPSPDAKWPVYALYRGQNLAEHEEGRHGVWWTPDPVYAEIYARTPSRARSGPGAVIAAFAPQNAIIAALCPTEFLVDPRQLEDVVLVAELPPYEPRDVRDLFGASRLMGIPSGYRAADLDQWLAEGRSVEGLPACRRACEQHAAEFTSAQAA